MKVEIGAQACVFTHCGREIGRYVVDDPFKPYLHPLRTPNGHCVTDCMPADHRHHKGMMYALRCQDLNFWEEDPGSGEQKQQALSVLQDAWGTGIQQDLLWHARGGGLETYLERREIVSRYDRKDRGFHWTWRSRRTALRTHRLIKSPWSFPLDDGRKINYHGLGIRLPRAWAFPGGSLSGVEMRGQAMDWKQACGGSDSEIRWWGRMDGFWSPPTVAVTIRQEQPYTWFVLKRDFAYLSVGPSNAREIDVPAGQVFCETYHIVVQDR